MKTIPSILRQFLSLTALMAVAFSCSVDSQKANPANEKTDTAVSKEQIDFTVDPFWPKPLPNKWVLGEVAGVAVDSKDHVWVLQRPKSLDERELGATKNPPHGECCFPAPSVIEFDPDGNVVQAWGNPDTTQRWISSEHGIFVDQESNVWISGSFRDHVVLKLSPNGEQLLQIGEYGKTNRSNDTTLLGGPTDIFVDTKANEVYITDGYVNRRVIVFDANTGSYKRHWGAYGDAPHDDELPAYRADEDPQRSFRNAVHAIGISQDSLLYVADRINNRIQVFKKDGTFIKESFIAKETLRDGSVWDIGFSPDNDQHHIYVADGMNMKVWILDRENLEIISSFGQGGRNAGQFGWIHNLAVDSKGNIYTAEVRPGKRIQKFKPVQH